MRTLRKEDEEVTEYSLEARVATTCLDESLRSAPFARLTLTELYCVCFSRLTRRRCPEICHLLSGREQVGGLFFFHLTVGLELRPSLLRTSHPSVVSHRGGRAS